MALLDLAGKASGSPLWRCSAPTGADRCAATRRCRPASPTRSPPTPSAGPSAGFDDLQAQGRRRRRRRAGARGPRGGRARRPGSASTRTAPGAPTRRSACCAMIEPLGIELAEQPVARARGDGRGRARDASIPIAADESVAERAGRRARAGARRLRPRDGEAGQGRRHRRGAGSPASSRSTSRAPSTARSGSPPRRTPPRRCRSPGRPPASPTASPPSACSPRRSPRASATLATATCSACPTARASASSSTRPRSSAAARGWLAFAAVDPTNRNTALASAMVEELARCGVRAP